MHTMTLSTVICLILALTSGFAGNEEPKRIGAAYPLTICPVSKRPLGESPMVVILEDMPDAAMNGREIKFCCGGCKNRFVADPKTSIEALDAEIVKNQLLVYPKANCIVMTDDAMTDPRGDKAMEDKNVVIGNRLFRFCCKACIRRFKRDPAKYTAVLDKLVIEQQEATYPLKVCVVSGNKLGPDPFQFVVANRLIKTCCGGCANRVKADPTAAIAMLDKAAKASAGTVKTSN